MKTLVSCDSLSKAYRFSLFEGISLSLGQGEKVGLIGPNGQGKSTLLKILAGRESPDEGTVFRQKGLRLAYLSQEESLPPEKTPREFLWDILQNENGEEDEKAVQMDIALSQVGFEDPKQAIHTLSGGWKKRLALAGELVKQPDFLLLDEPTNHLDIQGILWLETFLQKANFSYVLVSHDRYLLESTTSRIIELNKIYPQGYLSHRGNYSQFLIHRAEFLQAQKKLEASLSAKMRRESEWLSQGIKARGTRANFRIQKSSQLREELRDVKERNNPAQMEKLDFSGTGRKSRKLLEVKKLAKSLGGKKLFGDLDFILSAGTRLGIVGPNGCGKTTLLRLLAEDLEPDAGEMDKLHGVKLIWFDQHRDQLDKSQELRWALSPEGDQVLYQGRAVHIKAWAKRFHFAEEQLDLLVGALSGGEQSRILLSRMMVQVADILLLDEPTNDLDLATLDVLEEGLGQFSGALVLITHDRYLLDRLCTEILAINGQGEARLLADYSQWLNWINQDKGKKSKKEKKKKSPPVRKAPQPPKKSKGLNYREKQEWDGMEEKILEAEERLESCKKVLEDPEVTGDYQRLQDACKALENAQAQADKLYERWEELEAKLG